VANEGIYACNEHRFSRMLWFESRTPNELQCKTVTVNHLFINMSQILQGDSKVPTHLYEKKYSYFPWRTYTLAVTHYDTFCRRIQHTSHTSRIAVIKRRNEGALISP